MADAPAPNAPPDPAIATAHAQTELILAQLDDIRAHLRLVRGDMQTETTARGGMQTETNARGAQHVQGIQRTVAGLGQRIDNFELQTQRLEQQTQRLEQQTRVLEQQTQRLEQQNRALEQQIQCVEQQTQALKQQAQRADLEMQGPGPVMQGLMQGLQGLQGLSREMRTLQGLRRELQTQHAQIAADVRAVTEDFERVQAARNAVQRVNTTAAAKGQNVLVAKRALLQVPRAQRPDPWAPRARGRPLRVRICVLARKPRSPW